MELKIISKKLDTGFTPENEKYIAHLREMIACRTISEEKYYSKEAFDEFESVLERNYSAVFSKCERISLRGSTFLRVPGKSGDKPLVLMSHKDIVHEGSKKWKVPAYDGKVIKGKMFGRGTFDCKGSLCALFEAVESLLKEGFEPERDIYIFASASEEIAGNDAPEAVEYFRSKGIIPGLVIDEGGAVLRNPFPSPYKRFAMIGSVERSSGRLVFDCESRKKAKKFMKKAIKLRPGKYDMYPEVSSLVHGLSACLSAPFGNIFGLLDRHHGAARFILTHCGPDARSFCGALTGANLISGEEKSAFEADCGKLNNPMRVFVSGNFYNKIEDLTNEIKKLADSFGMKLISEIVRETERPVSPDSAGYKFAGDVAQQVFENIGVLPYPVLGRTDSRYFIGYAEDVIRFIPLEISLLQMMKFHCPNENIYVSSLPGAVKFYREAIKQYMQ